MLETKIKDIIEQANSAFDKRDWKTVVSCCETLLATNTELAHTYYLLGMANLDVQSYAIARHFFQQANILKPLHPSVMNNIATCEYELNNREEAIRLYKEAIERGQNDPMLGLYYSNLGGAYTGYGEPEEGEKWLRKSLETKCDIPHWSTRNNLAVVLLEQEKYKEGWSYYNDRLGNIRTFVPKNYCGKTLPQWNMEPSCKVVIYGEQGLGDEIMFASLLRKAIPDMESRGCEVILDCNSRLVKIMRNSFPQIKVYGTKNYQNQEDRTWDKIEKPDFQLAIGSLGQFYANDKELFDKTPYIKINDFIKIEGNRPKIGFSWYGGIAQTNIHNRYIALEKWKEIFKLPYDFISLQYNEDAGMELQQFKEKYGFENILHNSDIMADFDKTAELINGLDLIISSPQTCVHLAGSMGKEVWQLTPIKALWQMNVVDSWYDLMSIIRQSAAGEWEDVMEVVKQRLEDRYAAQK